MSRTMSAQRRSVIRSTFLSKYQSPLMAHVFFLASPTKSEMTLIAHENATHGDLVVLPIDTSAHTATTIKPFEFYKHLLNATASGVLPRYDWVSKLDDDTFLAAGPFYSLFLNQSIPSTNPPLPSSPSSHSNYSAINTTNPHPFNTTTIRKAEMTLISRRSRTPQYPDYDWPAGAFYTLSYPLLDRLTSLYIANPGADDPEDPRVGRYLYEAGVEYNFVDLPREMMMDVASEKGAYAPAKVGKKALVVHMIKEDGMFLDIADTFGERGWEGGGVEGITEGG